MDDNEQEGGGGERGERMCERVYEKMYERDTYEGIDVGGYVNEFVKESVLKKAQN